MVTKSESTQFSRSGQYPTCLVCPAQEDCFFADQSVSACLQTPLRKELRFKKSAIIYSEQTPSSGLYLLCQGSVKLMTATHYGKERIVSFVRTGELFGLDCFVGQGERRSDAVARETCTTYYIPKDDFRNAVSANKETLWGFSMLLINALQRMEAEKLIISGDSVERRLPETVSWLSQHLGLSGAAPCYLPPNLCELAETLGVAPETISRARAIFRRRAVKHSKLMRQLGVRPGLTIIKSRN